MVELKEEQKYKTLKRLGQQLHIPIVEAFLELEVKDKDGKVIQKHKQRSHTWTRNAYNGMFVNLAGKDADDTTFGAGKVSFKHSNGTVMYGNRSKWIDYYGSLDAFSAGYRAAAGQDTKGIVVGSGTNAESFEDYALQTQIANGTGAGQLSYIQSEEHAIGWNAATKIFKNELVRYFNNNSGGDVAVNEVGIFWYQQYEGGTYMLSRDKLATTVTVPNTGQLKVTYTVQLTYPV